MEEEILESRDYVEELVALIRSGIDEEALTEEINNYHDNDIAAALDELTPTERQMLYRILGLERVSEIFTYLDDVGEFLDELELDKAADIIENMDADDAVDALEDVDEETRSQLIKLIDPESKEDIELITSYDEDEIGSVMTTNYIEISRIFDVKQAMKGLIAQAEDNDNISTIYVKNEDDTFYGAIALKDLIVARSYTSLDELIFTSYPYVRDTDLISESLERLKDYAEDSIPVLNEKNILIGVITSQDIVEVVDDEMGDDYAKLAGLTEEEDLEESVFISMKKRLPWLGILLILGMGVSTVTGLFESVVSELAILVSFQSLTLGMAGNVGTQSLAVTIRVISDEQLEESVDMLKLAFKEIKIGFLNGLIIGACAFVIIGIYACAFKGKPLEYGFAVSACVGIAMVLAMTISSFVGAMVPLFFHKLNIDPAVASGPFISTINDLVAVVTYYGMAWLLLINVMGLTG